MDFIMWSSSPLFFSSTSIEQNLQQSLDALRRRAS
jgi:hypothetical protein